MIVAGRSHRAGACSPGDRWPAGAADPGPARRRRPRDAAAAGASAPTRPSRTPSVLAAELDSRRRCARALRRYARPAPVRTRQVQLMSWAASARCTYPTARPPAPTRACPAWPTAWPGSTPTTRSRWPSATGADAGRRRDGRARRQRGAGRRRDGRARGKRGAWAAAGSPSRRTARCWAAAGSPSRRTARCWAAAGSPSRTRARWRAAAGSPSTRTAPWRAAAGMAEPNGPARVTRAAGGMNRSRTGGTAGRPGARRYSPAKIRGHQVVSAGTQQTAPRSAPNSIS